MGSRRNGTNLRALGTNYRALKISYRDLGINPRALGINHKKLREDGLLEALANAELIPSLELIRKDNSVCVP